jgi:hypothetical protein
MEKHNIIIEDFYQKITEEEAKSIAMKDVLSRIKELNKDQLIILSHNISSIKRQSFLETNAITHHGYSFWSYSQRIRMYFDLIMILRSLKNSRTILQISLNIASLVGALL